METLDHMRVERGKTFVRYNEAMRDLMANPGKYSSQDWAQKHHINRSAAHVGKEMGLIEVRDKKLVCTRVNLHTQMVHRLIDAVTMNAARNRPVQGGPRLVELVKPTIINHERRQVSLLWGLVKWDR